MFPLLMPLLIGAGLGAVANKKDPLKGALLGAGLGAAGGTLAAGGGGLLGSAPAASGASAGAAGAAGASTTAGQTATLLGLPESAAFGPQSQSAMLAAQNEGFGLAGDKLLSQAAEAPWKSAMDKATFARFAGGAGKGMATSLPAFNPITGTYANATQLPGMTGAMETLKSFNSAVKPVGEAMGTAKLAQGLLAEPEMAHPPAMPIQSQPLDLSGVLNSNQQEMARTFEEDMKRRQSMGEYARYAMGAR